MQVNCNHCGKMLNRPPSRVKANKQFCDKACYDAYQVRRVAVQCSICNKPLEVHPCKLKTQSDFTCGPACNSELIRRRRIAYFNSADKRIATCDQCGQQFERKPSQLEKYGTSFCCKRCKDLYEVGKTHPEQHTHTWHPCEVCGKVVKRIPATLREHVFCSRKCQAMRQHPPSPLRGKPQPKISGERNHNWKGGRSLLPYAPGFTRMTSRRIRERDGNRCKICGTSPRRPGDLVAHHMDFSKHNHDPSNLITLCRTCHQDVHNGKVSLQLSLL